jgi:deoxyribose-phosphate aldolase
MNKINNMMKKNIAKIIDQTNIDPKTRAEDIKKTCEEAKKYNFRGVCVNPEWVKLVSRELNGTKIKTICLVDPPIGDSLHQKRVQICKKAKKDRANETDVVISLPDIKHERWDKVLADLKEICKILPTKVIIGSGYLTDEEIIKASKIVKRSGAICVKTATDKDPLEHRELEEKARHLKLMKKSAPGLLVKASGKIKNLQDLKAMVKVGADIIGTSLAGEIMQQLLEKIF